MTGEIDLGLSFEEEVLNHNYNPHKRDLIAVYPNVFDSKEGFDGAINRVYYQKVGKEWERRRRIRLHGPNIEINESVNGPFNGFAETKRHTILSNDSIAYFFEGYNYSRGVKPPAGLTMYKPIDIAENMTEYIRVGYKNNKLSDFGFETSHYSQKAGKFTGKSAALSARAGENIVDDSKFQNVYTIGRQDFEVGSTVFTFEMIDSEKEILFKMDQALIARMKSEIKYDYGMNLRLSLVPHEVNDDPTFLDEDLFEFWKTADLLALSPLNYIKPTSRRL